ncbi:MAG: hypothetical protein WC943_15915, partial [Elusimicrobiota bacterium]|jgi:hypothetical protein
LVKASKGTGKTADLKLSRFDLFDNGRPTYDILKTGFLDPAAIHAARPRYLVMTSVNDRPSGDELALMYLTDSHRRRAATKAAIERDYRAIKTVSPSIPCTPFFPHLMDEDYRAIRSWSPSVRGRARGPIITVWERRNGHD